MWPGLPLRGNVQAWGWSLTFARQRVSANRPPQLTRALATKVLFPKTKFPKLVTIGAQRAMASAPARKQSGKPRPAPDGRGRLSQRIRPTSLRSCKRPLTRTDGALGDSPGSQQARCAAGRFGPTSILPPFARHAQWSTLDRVPPDHSRRRSQHCIAPRRRARSSMLTGNPADAARRPLSATGSTN